MLFTRESDYGIRVLRFLADGNLRQVSQICEAENIPQQYCYKIMKKLEIAKLITSKRGRDGGYQLLKPLDSFTLLDIVAAVDNDFSLMHCLSSDKPCSMNSDSHPCTFHVEFERIQGVLEVELGRVTFKDLVARNE